jgi:hypothetical protein
VIAVVVSKQTIFIIEPAHDEKGEQVQQRAMSQVSREQVLQ